jgi:hypothetical protein
MTVKILARAQIGKREKRRAINGRWDAGVTVAALRKLPKP